MSSSPQIRVEMVLQLRVYRMQEVEYQEYSVHMNLRYKAGVGGDSPGRRTFLLESFQRIETPEGEEQRTSLQDIGW